MQAALAIHCAPITNFDYTTVNGAKDAESCLMPNPAKAMSKIMFAPEPRMPTMVPSPNFGCLTFTPMLKALKSLPAVGFGLFALPILPYTLPPFLLVEFDELP